MTFTDFKGAQQADDELLNRYDPEVTAKVTDWDGEFFEGFHLALRSQADGKFLGWVDFPDFMVYVAQEREL